MAALNDPEQQHENGMGAPNRQESQGKTTPRLMVGSLAGFAGEVAVVEAHTGHICWVRRTGRIQKAFVLDDHAAYLAPGGTFAMQKRLQRAAPDSAEWERRAAQLNVPTQLEARRADNGALLWTHAHPLITGQMHVEVDSGVVVAANPRHFEEGAPDIQAFDAVSGRPLWTLGQHRGRREEAWFLTARGGRAYASLNANFEEITALEIHSGQPLWQRRHYDHRVFSPNGALIGERPSMDDFILIDARDGSELAHIPLQGLPQILTKDGIVYGTMDFGPYEEQIAAIDARTGKRLWQTQAATGGSLGYDRGILYYAHVHPERRFAEVGTLDAATGERLWQWHSPTNLAELLRLWEPHRLPLMLWNSTEKSAATVSGIVGQPWFRLRRPPSRFREPPRQQTLGARMRDIRQEIASNIAWPLWREVAQGRWRHPWQLHNGINLCWPVARWGIVFLGTWLGLFALDAADGHLLWHALPTLDLSSVEPALAP